MDSVALLIGASIAPLQKGLKKAQGVVSDFGAKASKLIAGSGGVGGAIAGLFAGASVAAGVKIALGKFMEVEDANARLQAALTLSGNTAQGTMAKIAAAGSQLSKTTTTSQAAFAAAAATMAKIAGIKGDENLIKTAKAAVDLGAALGKDGPAADLLASALQNPSEGMYELARAGLAFSDAQLRNIQDLERSGDLLGAQAALLEVVRINTEGAAEAAGTTLSGKLAILHNAFDRIAAVIGEAIAPAVKMAVDWLTQWVAGLETAESKNALWDYTAQAAGFVANALQAINIGWQIMKTGAAVALAIAIDGFALLVDGINLAIRGLNKLGAGFDEIDTKGIKAFQKGAWAAADDQAHVAAKAMMEPWRGNQVVKEYKKELQDTKAKGVDAFNAIGDATKKAALDMKNLTARQIDLHKEAKRLAESLENPLEKFEREMKHLNELKANGLDDKTFARARAKLVMDFQGAIPQQKIAAGGALSSGSQQLRSGLLAYRQSLRNADPRNAMEKIAAQQLEKETQSEVWLRQLAKNQPQVAAFAGL